MHRAPRRLRPLGAAFAAAMLTAPAGFAAGPGLGMHGAAFASANAGRISAPWLHKAALSDTTMAGIRGGFDVTPQLTIDFAYRQITTINGTVVASVMIPNVHLSLGTQGPSVSGTPTVIATTPAMPAPSPSAAGPGITTTVSHIAAPAPAPAPTPMPAPSTTQAASQTTAAAPPTSLVNVNGAGSQLLSHTLTRISPSAITTVVQNMQNNAVIQQAGWANISVAGLPAAVTRLSGTSMMNRNLIAASRAFR